MSKLRITEFRGEYAFLSNFFECPVNYKGYNYRNSEAAFQSAKTDDPVSKAQFTKMNASQAKSFGRRVDLNPNWEKIKNEIMIEVLTAKFLQNPNLKARLLATGDAELIEGNDWNDRYWGVDKKTGIGQNMLGHALMHVRQQLRESDSL